MKAFPTFWAISVQRNDPSRSGVGSAAETLEAALAEAYYHATFYASNDGATVELAQLCKACSGTGIARRTPRRTVRCKACKGHPELQRVEFIARISDDCELLRHGKTIALGRLAPGKPCARCARAMAHPTLLDRDEICASCARGG